MPQTFTKVSVIYLTSGDAVFVPLGHFLRLNESNLTCHSPIAGKQHAVSEEGELPGYEPPLPPIDRSLVLKIVGARPRGGEQIYWEKPKS